MKLFPNKKLKIRKVKVMIHIHLHFGEGYSEGLEGLGLHRVLMGYVASTEATVGRFQELGVQGQELPNTTCSMTSMRL